MGRLSLVILIILSVGLGTGCSSQKSTSSSGGESETSTENSSEETTTETTSSSTSSITLYATADTWVGDSSSIFNSNFGGERDLRTGDVSFGGAGTTNYRAFVKFNVSNIPSNAKISKANLILNTGANSVPCGSQTVTGTVVVSEVSTSWTESGLTYLNMPSSFSYLNSQDVIFNDCLSRQYSVSVVNAVSGWVSGASSNGALSLKANTISDYGSFYSKEVSQSAGPVLEIEYTS